MGRSSDRLGVEASLDTEEDLDCRTSGAVRTVRMFKTSRMLMISFMPRGCSIQEAAVLSKMPGLRKTVGCAV